MTPELSVQSAIRARLVATSSVIQHVPAKSILDRHRIPAPLPSIIIGESVSRDDDSMQRLRTVVFADLHIWQREISLVGVKVIAWEIKKAIRAGRLALDAGFHCVDAKVASMRFVRDPDGETSHGIVTVECMVEETT